MRLLPDAAAEHADALTLLRRRRDAARSPAVRRALAKLHSDLVRGVHRERPRRAR